MKVGRGPGQSVGQRPPSAEIEVQGRDLGFGSGSGASLRSVQVAA